MTEAPSGEQRSLRCGILGGTFDPPHLAHLALARAARETLHLDRVLFIPAGDPWRKAGREVTPAADRLAMLRAAVADLPWAEVRTIEVERPGPTYTSETVEAMACDGCDWWFILGEDALHDLPAWHEPERVLATVRLAVARRAPASGEAARPLLTPELVARFPDIASRVDDVPLPDMPISATEIRDRVRQGRPTEDLVPPAVRDEIDARRLYGAPSARAT